MQNKIIVLFCFVFLSGGSSEFKKKKTRKKPPERYSNEFSQMGEREKLNPFQLCYNRVSCQGQAPSLRGLAFYDCEPEMLIFKTKTER